MQHAVNAESNSRLVIVGLDRQIELPGHLLVVRLTGRQRLCDGYRNNFTHAVDDFDPGDTRLISCVHANASQVGRIDRHKFVTVVERHIARIGEKGVGLRRAGVPDG